MTLGILGAIACAAALYELIKGDSITLKIFAGTTFFVNFGYIALYNKTHNLGNSCSRIGNGFTDHKNGRVERKEIGVAIYWNSSNRNNGLNTNTSDQACHCQVRVSKICTTTIS